MSRAAHQDGRGAVATVLAALVLLTGVFAGAPAQASHHVSHADVQRKADLGVRAPAVAPNQRLDHQQRAHGPSTAMLPVLPERTSRCFSRTTTPPRAQSVPATCQALLRGRAPPA